MKENSRYKIVMFEDKMQRKIFTKFQQEQICKKNKWMLDRQFYEKMNVIFQLQFTLWIRTKF